MTEQHECWWVIRVELNGRIIAECNDPLCPGELGFLQISRRLNGYETLKKENETLKEYILEEVGAEHVLKEWGGELS